MSLESSRRRWIGSIALLGFGLLCSACFEQPVTEKMEIRFLPGNAAMVRVTVKLANPEQFRESEAARERIEDARREIREERDPWTRRLQSLEPVAERTTWDREKGDLVLSDHRVVLEDAQILRRFFSDTLLRASLTIREKETEFTLVPGPGSRATRQQEEAFRHELETWASAAARYLQTGGELYRYLEANPDRAEACFASLFEAALSDEAKEGRPKPTSEDRKALDPLQDAMGEVLDLFSVPPDSAFSPDELSRLVYDPFPASLTLRVPGTVLEVEGFQDQGSGHLRVPPLSIWEAFARIQGRWLSPSPVVIYYQHLHEGKTPLDLADFLGRPRSAAPAPSPSELVRTLEEGMKPALVYRVRWSTGNLPQPEREGGVLWDDPSLRD